MQSTSATVPYSSSAFSIGGVLSRTFSVIKQRFGLLFAIAAVPTLITSAIGGLLFLTFMGSIRPGQPTSAGFGVSILLVAFVYVVSGLAILGAFCYAVFHVLAGNRITFSSALAAAAKRIVPLVLTSIVIAVALYVGLLLLVIPGLILLCLFNVVIPVCMVEKTGVIKSITRSIDLTEGYRWKIFGLILLTTLGYLVAAIGMIFVTNVLVSILPSTVGIVAGLIWQFAFSIVISMVMYGVMSVTYHDLRVAKEGITASSLTKVFD